MKLSSLATVCLLICAFAGCKGMAIVNDYDPGHCNQSNHGQEVLVYDRQNKGQILICTRNDGFYQWTTAGGENPIGEIFNPAYDCSDILDNYPEATNGMYWIHLGGSIPKQVWCDMDTDGGGYMLIGRKNTSKTWSLPSSEIPVEPSGYPHWASYLGDSPVLDFRIQVAKYENFSKTIAHWSLRIQSERPLKKLLIMDEGGCGPTSPGIGNIAYVKDLRTENIVTTKFRCSTFGSYFHPSTTFGWGMMNSCLNKPCHRGFAFIDHPTIEYQLAHSGSFSYSTSGNTSGITHSSTAFVGCDKGVCCGCYGPVGGTDDYCGTDCTAKNGGTVVKNVYTWFWVRSSLPKKVWNKCMDYKVTTEDGDAVWYRLLDGRTTPEKGRCPKNEALLNEGIVVVPDGQAAGKVPEIPGLLQYRKDNKELYVRSNETWKVIAPEKKILKKAAEMVTPVLQDIEQKLQKENKTILQKTLEVVSKLTDIDQKFHNQNQTVLKILNSGIVQLKSGFDSEIAEIKQAVKTVNNTLNNLLQNVRGPLFESVILSGDLLYHRLLESWIPVGVWNNCWRATRDGWSASTFHSNCDYRAPTVTIVRVGNYTFGGYSTAFWEGSQWKQAPGSFIFSLRNKENQPPFKAPLKDRNTQYAIYVDPSYGPTFGGGHDFYISDNAGSNINSYTNFNNNYQPPSGVSHARSILAGSYNFCPSEVEVFYLVRD